MNLPQLKPIPQLQLRLALVLCFLLGWMCTIYVRAPIPITMIGFLSLALFEFSGRFPFIHPRRGLAGALKAFAKTPYLSLTALFPILYALPLLWSEVPGYTLGHAQRVLPALALPLAFFLLRDQLRPYRNALWLGFLGCAAIGALACSLYTLHNQDALVVGLGQGRVVPTPLMHVRFATALAFAGLIGVYLTSRTQLPDMHRWFAAVLTLVVVLGIHFIAVRTGLALFYGGLLLLGARILLQRWAWPKALLVLLTLVMVSVYLAWQLPAVNKKLAYMRYDLEQVDDADATEYSDASRILSVQAGWAIIGKHPFFGSPRANFRAAMATEYASMGRPEAYLMPTNQIIFSWALAGIFGLIGLMSVFFGPLFQRGWWQQAMLAETLVLLAVLCLVETPLSSDVGLALTFLMIGLARLGPFPQQTDQHRAVSRELPASKGFVKE